MSSNSGYRHLINPEVMVVGIDVAKRQHVAAIRLPGGLMMRPVLREKSI